MTHYFVFVFFSEEILERVRAKQEQEMDQVKKKVAEEMQKSMMEELQEQFSTAEPEESEAPEDGSLQTQTGTEEAPNTAGSNRCFSVWRKKNSCSFCRHQ